MKFIHTGDWHIGKVINEVSMLEDQVYILEQLIRLLEEEKPDALVIAGDLYDRSVPPARAVEVLNQYLMHIVLKLRIPVLVVAGNHDSGERLDFASGVMAAQGLHIEGVPKLEIRRVTLEDEFGLVDFYLLPYLEPAMARHLYEDETIKTHEDAMGRVIQEIRKMENPGTRAVVVAHGYVTYMSDAVEESESERPLSIGGTDKIHGSVFDGFNYVALGHLHGPQQIGGDRMRYAGSLLKYSFSEEKQRKSMCIVSLDKEGDVSVRLKSLPIRRDMRTIKGTIDELTHKSYYSLNNIEDYVFATLTDEGEVYEPLAKLRAIYPNIMGVRKETKETLDYEEVVLGKDHREKSKLELFRDFYENVTQNTFDETREQMMTEMIQNATKEEVE
ncbi:MAG: exonuclease SbcCD subunit D [Cellulosilyticaceae bacterium]